MTKELKPGTKAERSFLVQRAAIDEAKRTVELAFSSEEPYDRWWGREILDHSKKSIAADAWSTAYFGVAGAANAAGGMWAPSWGIQPDTSRNARHSHCHFFRGTSAVVDTLNIAGAATGSWSSAIVIDGAVTTTAASCGAYAPYDNEGRMFYMNIYVASAINQIYRFDVKHRVLAPFTPTDLIQAGTAAQGKRMAAYCAVDGSVNYDCVLLQSHLAVYSQEMIPLV